MTDVEQVKEDFEALVQPSGNHQPFQRYGRFSRWHVEVLLKEIERLQVPSNERALLVEGAD
jgi:hypothetical protein